MMKDYWVEKYQDYQDGRPFRGRALFGTAANLASVVYRAGYALQRRIVRWQWWGGYRARGRVIGVGNLTVGGSGKTSLVDYLASRLIDSGKQVTILTRGYGRQSTARVVIAPGEAGRQEVWRTGDEPLMLASRNPQATVIIDANRAAAARDYENQAAPDVFLLDDALQYHQLAYDCRIMTLLDGEIQPPYRLFPAGRWREPPSRVKDVDAIVVVIRRQEQNIQADEDQLRKLGFTGPIFPFAYELISWCGLDGQPAGLPSIPEERAIGVFCALAQPQRFLDWLVDRGIAIDQVRRFADHHPYRQEDLNELCAWARAKSLNHLVTTEKDAVKLSRFPAGDTRIIFPRVRLIPCGGAEEFDRFVQRIVGHG